MTFSNKILISVCLLLLCLTQSGCDLLMIPLELLGSVVSTAVGIGSQAAQVGIAAAPYAAPFFL